jgi:hypothetical protein
MASTNAPTVNSPAEIRWHKSASAVRWQATSAAFSVRWENVAARNKVNNLNYNFAHEEAFLSATHG